MVTTFFDLVTFFGVASFFAWLTFAPLQSDQLDKFKNFREAANARRNFAAINDYFLASFLSYALAGVCDYLYHYYLYQYSLYRNPAIMSYFPVLYSLVGLGFFAGVTGLLWAMLYVRMIVKGEKTWCDVNPPGMIYTLVVFGITVVVVFIAFQSANVESVPLHKLLYICAAFVTGWGGWRVIRYHDEDKWKKKHERRGVIGMWMLLLPLFLLGFLIMPLLQFLHL